MSRIISLTVRNAPAMQAHVAVPRGQGPFPGIILFHDALGVNAHIRKVADGLATEGFVVIAPELFHRTAPAGFEARPYQLALAMPHVKALKNEHLEEDMKAVHKWLSSQGNVAAHKLGAVGFSLGGKFSFIAHDVLKLSAAVSVYGGMLQKETARIKHLNGHHLFVWGGKDEYITADHANKVISGMKEHKKPYSTIEISDAGHGFFFDDNPGYNKHAAQETWGCIKAFFKSRLS